MSVAFVDVTVGVFVAAAVFVTVGVFVFVGVIVGVLVDTTGVFVTPPLSF